MDGQFVYRIPEGEDPATLDPEQLEPDGSEFFHDDDDSTWAVSTHMRNARETALYELVEHGNEAAMQILIDEHDVDPYELRTKLGMSTEGFTKQPDAAFSLFLKPEHPVVVTRTQDTGKTQQNNRDRSGVQRTFVNDHNGPVSALWHMLHSPSSNRAEILKRQSVIDELVNDTDLLQDVADTSVAFMGYHDQIQSLYMPFRRGKGEFADFTPVDQQPEQTSSPAEEPENDFEEDWDNWPDEEDWDDESWGDDEIWDDDEPGHSDEVPKLLAIEELILKGVTADNLETPTMELMKRLNLDTYQLGALEALKRYAQLPQEMQSRADRLRTSSSDTFKQAAEATDSYRKAFEGISAGDLLAAAKTKDFSHMQTVLPPLKLARRTGVLSGALAIFSHRAATEGFARVTLGARGETAITQGWNLAYNKSTPGVDGSEQVLNNSPPDVDISVLTGSNMGGKTFLLDTTLLQRMAGQAFGYTPAESATIEPKDGLFMLDRSSSDTLNDLSAMGVENRAIARMIKGIGANALCLLDETLSTTGQLDRSALGEAIVEHLVDDLGAQVILAEHNEPFIEVLAAQDNTSIHHLGVRDADNGDIEFTYELNDGQDEPHTFRVAERIGVPETMLEAAKMYIDGKPHVRPSTAEQAPDFGVSVDHYTHEERLELMSQPRSFSHLLLSKPTLRARLDDHKAAYDFLQLEDGVEYDTPTHFHSFSRDAAISGDRGLNRHDFIKFVMNIPISTDSKELYERQQLFRELQDPAFRAELKQKTVEVRELLGAWSGVVDNPEMLDNIVSSIVEGLRMYVNQQTYSVGQHEMFAVPVLQAFEKFGLIDPEDAVYKAEMEKLHKLIGLTEKAEQLEDHIDELHERREAAETKEEQDAIQAQISSIAFGTLHKDLPNEAAELLGDHDFGERGPGNIHNVIQIQLQRIVAGISVDFSDYTFEKIDRDALCKLTDTAYEAATNALILDNQLSYDGNPSFHGSDRGLGNISNARAVTRLFREEDPVETMLEMLRSTDSVHLHQYANYLEPLINAYRDNYDDREAFIGEVTGKTQLKRWKRRFWSADPLEAMEVRRQVYNLSEIITMADYLHHFELQPVEFNDTGEVDIREAFHFVKEVSGYPEKQRLDAMSYSHRRDPRTPKDTPQPIRNTFTALPEQRTTLYTGTNMSGKTYGMQTEILAQRVAQAIGYAPALYANVPIYDSIVYIDRVRTDSARNLSALGNEATQWVEIDGIAQAAKAKGRQILVGVDEGWTTTSPRYENAMVYGTDSWAAENNVRLRMAAHAHEAVDRLATENPSAVKAVHFATHIGDDGLIEFDYRIRDGHEQSQGIEVARKLGGIPVKVLDRAEEIRELALAA